MCPLAGEAHRSARSEKKKKPVALCPHFFKEVISVKEDTPAIQAFETMVDRDVQVCPTHRYTVPVCLTHLMVADMRSLLCCQGVAVIDKDGKLVGNLSIRDLKLIGPRRFHVLASAANGQELPREGQQPATLTAHFGGNSARRW